MYPSQDQVYGACAILLFVSTFAVAARFYVRVSKRTGLQADDWTILVGLVLTWFMAISLIVGGSMGAIGTHTLQDPVTGELIVTDAEVNESKIDYIFYLCMIPAMGLIKLSVLLLYRRIFTTPVFNKVSMAFCIFIGIWSLGFFIAEIFQCGVHPAAIWTSVDDIAMYCVSQGTFQLAFSGTDIITDVGILLLPVFMVGKLQMRTRMKVAIIGIFMLGTLSMIAGIARLVVTHHNQYAQDPLFADLIGVSTLIFVCGQAEASVAVLAACLPTLRPLASSEKFGDSFIRRLMSRFTSYNSSSGGKSSQYSHKASSHGSRGKPAPYSGNHARWHTSDPKHAAVCTCESNNGSMV